MRGKRRLGLMLSVTDRLIPACAGKTKWTYNPHSKKGLIPACAGKTVFTSLGPAQRPAHPRVCGENYSADSIIRTLEGPSPRVRGKLLPPGDPNRAARLIPACAGKTGRCGRGAHRAEAHPRVCGENCYSRHVGEDDSGSSPRVRGKPRGWYAAPRPPRLIPACAGKTESRKRPARRTAAHPRVCGENEVDERVGMIAEGSSPRVRGKLNPDRAPGRRLGLIPACAGKTQP